MSGKRSLCVHGHFYQPPRVNPFTGEVPREPGAEPHHDFNGKVDAECYRPNAELGNFGLMSFNLGPTLAEWLEKHDPLTYSAILAAERNHYERYGCSNALAQPYNHTILPLATLQEKRTQIAWGMRDYQHRFGHAPEGMWLAETAVDLATLETMAERGIAFTILAPWQIEGLTPAGSGYVSLGNGKKITVTPYDGVLNEAVSFNPQATENADVFAAQILPQAVNGSHSGNQLALIASDGELYGHHLPHRDQFLAHLLKEAAPRAGFEVVSLAHYHRMNGPQREISIVEDTSWSCHHGIRRWKESCDCIEGNGSWKPFLRKALDDLAREIDEIYEKEAEKAFSDPWKLVEELIRVKLGEMSYASLFHHHQSDESVIRYKQLVKLLEAQYYRHLMFTSCGFFFEDISRLEPAYLLTFAAKAISLVTQAIGSNNLELKFLGYLSHARSWKTGQTGADIYLQAVRASDKNVALSHPAA